MWQVFPPLGIEDAQTAYKDIQKILKPKQKTGPGYGFDPIIQERLEQVHQFLCNYTDPATTAHRGTAGSSWQATSEQTAYALGKGVHLAQNLQKWAHAFIIDCNNLPSPNTSSGWWNKFLLDNKTLAQEISVHLQGIGRYAKAIDIVQFLDTPEMKEQLGHTTSIYHSTAKQWMKKLGFNWANIPKGQYIDGHEHEEVVTYQQEVFLPKLAEIDPKIQKWTKAWHSGYGLKHGHKF